MCNYYSAIIFSSIFELLGRLLVLCFITIRELPIGIVPGHSESEKWTKLWSGEGAAVMRSWHAQKIGQEHGLITP
jgi:hypothetical protein